MRDDTPGAENVRRARQVCDWSVAEKVADRVLPPQALLTGILYAATAQAEELLAIPYGPGQDTVTVSVTGDSRAELLDSAFWEAAEFFGPEHREMEVAEPWNADANTVYRQAQGQPRTQGKWRATIVIREKV